MASIITPEAILSFPRLFTPEAQNEGETPKYSCALIFPPSTDIKALKLAAIAAAKEKWGDKAEPMIRAGKLRMPFRTDDKTEYGYPEGSTYMNVRTTKKPGIVSIYPDPNTGKPLPILDEEEIFAGIIVRASLSAYGYDVSGNRGVTFGLNNLQKIRDGERLDGRKPAEDEFEADKDAVADLGDMEEPVEDQAVEESGDEGDDPLAALVAD